MADPYAGRRVLVAGGLGFIGSNLALALVERGAEVTLVDAMLPGFGAQRFNVEPILDRVQLDVSDLRDIDSLRQRVRGQDVVFNLAGQVSHLRSMIDPLSDLETNCRSPLALLECCRVVNPGVKLVLASTRQVYGRPIRLPVDERHPTRPIDVNGIHKLAAESYYQLYAVVHGMRTAILRLTNTYGPRMDLRSPDKGFLGVFLRRALTGGTLELYGGGGQRRDFNYVDDVVAALLAAGSSDATTGEIFNLGHEQCCSLLEVVEILRGLTGCDFECVDFPEEQRVIDVGDYWGDFGKFRAATGWTPKVDLAEGLARTVAFVGAHADRYV